MNRILAVALTLSLPVLPARAEASPPPDPTTGPSPGATELSLSSSGKGSSSSPPGARRLEPAEAQRDLEALDQGLRAAHIDLFASTPEAVFAKRRTELHQRWARPITRGELHAELQRYVALARHAHARIVSPHPGWVGHVTSGGSVLPLRLRVHAGRTLVVSAPEGSAARRGDVVWAVEGIPVDAWLERLTRNISADTSTLALGLLEGAEPFYVWLEHGPLERFEVELDRGRVVLPAVKPSERGGADLRLTGREARMLDGRIAYLRPGPFLSLEATDPSAYFLPEARDRFAAWVDHAFAPFLEAGAASLILDLRDNPGETAPSRTRSWSGSPTAPGASPPTFASRSAPTRRPRMPPGSSAQAPGKPACRPATPSSTPQPHPGRWSSSSSPSPTPETAPGSRARSTSS